jgi:antitoxin component of MazEF toxin-antitoxin module
VPSPSFSKAWVLVLLSSLSAVVGGCRHIGVKPHQRELLADRIMSLEGNAQERAADEHVLANREGAVGATGTSGGGCGCN